MRHIVAAMFLILTALGVAASETAQTQSDLSVTGDETTTFERFHAHVTSKNPGLDDYYSRRLFELYAAECQAEGVSLVVALSQMIHETNYLLFTGAVRPTQYNYGGMGSTFVGNPGIDFVTMRTGIRAHVQHLKAYGSVEPLQQDLVDPRFHYVVRGSAPTVMALAGRWAVDPDYGPKVPAHAHRMLVPETGQ